MVRVQPEGLVVRPFAGGVAVRRGRERIAAAAVVAVQETRPEGRLVVERKPEHRLRHDVEEELGKAGYSTVEAFERTRHARAKVDAAFEVLPRELVAVVPDVAVGMSEESVPQEVALEMAVAVQHAAQAHDVALGRVPAVLEHRGVAVVVDFAAPVLVVPVAASVPVPVVRVRVDVVSVVDLQPAPAEVAELPAEPLSEGDAPLAAEVEPRGPGKPPFARLEGAREVIDVLREEVCAPTAGIARHDAPSVVRVERIVPEREPGDGNAERAQNHVLRDDIPVSLGAVVADLARNGPVEAARLVRAGRDERAGREVPVVAAPFGKLRLEFQRGRDGADVAGCHHSGRRVAGGQELCRDIELGRQRHDNA